MSRAWIIASCWVVVACGPAIEPEDEPLVVEHATWSVGPATTRGPMTAVCIPLADEEACLRITMVMGVSGEPSHVSGSVVAPDCVVDPDADVLVDNFDGTAFTGHGGLWMTGVASLDDGSARELDIEAGLGDCEI